MNVSEIVNERDISSSYLLFLGLIFLCIGLWVSLSSFSVWIGGTGAGYASGGNLSGTIQVPRKPDNQCQPAFMHNTNSIEPYSQGCIFRLTQNISMFSMCSELTPRAPIPDSRIAQFMQPRLPKVSLEFVTVYFTSCLNIVFLQRVASEYCKFFVVFNCGCYLFTMRWWPGILWYFYRL